METLSEIYTPLAIAREEIRKRWDDPILEEKIGKFLQGDIPEFLRDKPKAYLAKHLISPNFNFFHYLESAKAVDLEPAMPEYQDDKFVSLNDDKYHLGKMFFYNGKGRNGGLKISTKTILDFNLADGRRFCDIKTIWGQALPDFHHQLTESLAPGSSQYIFDISGWMSRNGGSADFFYSHFFVLFLRNSILFENFLNKDKYQEFNKRVVIPSFEKIQNIFGIKPLVVPTVPFEIECDPYLWYYPGEAEKIVEDLFRGGVS
jgi:hypothetical protein